MKRLSRQRFDRLPPRVEGFTLVEMLTVIAIMGILAVLTAPAITGVLGTMNLKGAAASVVAQFDLARQTASTRGLATELRIYQDSNTTDISANKPAFRYISVVIPLSASGVPDEFVSPGIGLAGDTICDQTFAPNDYSTMIDPSLPDGSGNSRTTLLQEPNGSPAPLQLRQKYYQRITFMPNGTVNLTVPTASGATIWCLTLRSNKAKAVTTPVTKPANNFITLVLDPSTSRVRVYQP